MKNRILFIVLIIFEAENVAAKRRPNLILIVADDVGYGDFYHTGHPTQEKNEIDIMAENGMRFTHYMATERACTPNRAAMLTGRYAARMGLYGETGIPVFAPYHSTGLPKIEITMAEALHELGYKTGLNKHNSTDGSHLPHNHGFHYVGRNLPMSHSPMCGKNEVPLHEKAPWCILYNGSKLFEQPYDTKKLTPRMLNDAKNFIRKNRKDKFFLYISSPQPRDITYSSNKFAGKSKRGIVGDGINELAWMTGEILNEVKRNALDKVTLVMFVNDHGPANWGCQPSFSIGPFSGKAGTGWEGAIRGPAIAWWPGRIKNGTVSSSIVSSVDIFPTFLSLAGNSRYLKQRNITCDGRAIKEISAMQQPIRKNRFLVHYCGRKVMAARLNQYKIHFFTKRIDIKIGEYNPFCDFKNMPWIKDQMSCNDKYITIQNPPLLFNTDEDPAESHPLDVERHQEIIAKIKAHLKDHRESVVIPTPGLLDAAPDKSLIPCCNPPSCVCV